MKASIIVATHNRAENLRTLLQSLESQDPPGSEWEVIIVDNDSSDHTKEISQTFQTKTGNFHYLVEKRRGKSHALNAGIRIAQGDLVVFTDDDCIPEVGWLRSVISEFASDPSLSVLGGRVELYCKHDRPVTLRTYRDRILFSSTDQLFSLVAGCNMAIRKTVFDVVGGFDPVLGPGTKMAAAEDAELLYRIFDRGFKIAYSPDVLVYHNHGRRTDAQVQALNHCYVVGRGAFYCKHILRGDLQVLKMAYWEISPMVRSLVQRRFSGQSAREQRAFLWDLLTGVGYISSSLRQFASGRLTSKC